MKVIPTGPQPTLSKSQQDQLALFEGRVALYAAIKEGKTLQVEVTQPGGKTKWVDRDEFANSRPFQSGVNYRVKPETLQINWDAVAKRIKFVAVDYSGEVWGYVAEPRLNQACNCWSNTNTNEGSACRLDRAIDFPRFNGHWTESLTERP